jgi:2-amino-4-hydroxy-6-hydroxymethyldihydropteridine diphosphokinase
VSVSTYLGLGSNVGDRRHHLEAAIEALRRHGVEVDAVSSLYETEPVGEILDQPDFLNAVVRIRTGLEPEELLDLCKAIEVEQGRMLGGQRHGPRPLDVDLLLVGDLELTTEHSAGGRAGGARAGTEDRAGGVPRGGWRLTVAGVR